VACRCGRSVPHGEEPGRDPHVHAVRGVRVVSPGQRFLQGASGVLRPRVPQPQPQRYLPHFCLRSLLRSFLGDQAPLGTFPEIFPSEAPAQHQQPPSSWGGGAGIQMREDAADSTLLASGSGRGPATIYFNCFVYTWLVAGLCTSVDYYSM
jgi:hypothetical protein